VAAGGGERDDVGGVRRVVAEQFRVAETAVPIATLGVEDPQLRPSSRRPVAAPCHDRLGALTYHVPAEPDPRLPLELQPEPGRFGDGGREPGGQARWLERDEEGLGPAGEPGQPSEPIGDLGRRGAGGGSWREVDHEDVDRAGGEEHPGDRQALVEGLGCQDHEPVEADAAGHGLDRIEGTGEVEPGHDRAVGLGLGDQPEGEGGGAGARRAVEGDARVARQPAGPYDRVEGWEAGPDDPLDAGSRLAGGRRRELGRIVRWLVRERRRGQRPDHPRSCGTPPRLEGRQSRRDVRGEAGHRTASIEHPFDIVNGMGQVT
jgi:hypothetical protein